MLGDLREVGQVFFGADGAKLDAEGLAAIAEMGRKVRARREEIIREITAEMWQRINEAME